MPTDDDEGGFMLVSDRYEFVVALPTKTGTNSMRNMAELWVRNGGSPEALREERTMRHRMVVPEGCEHYARYMMVRNPYDRFISMYHYLLSKDWEWENRIISEMSLGASPLEGFAEFMLWYHEQVEKHFDDPWSKRKLHGGRPYCWTDSLGFMRDYLARNGVEGADPQPVRALPIEHIRKNWVKLRKHHDARELYGTEPKHANVGRARKEANREMAHDIHHYFGQSRELVEVGSKLGDADSFEFEYNFVLHKARKST